jgi:hypothetical protein
MNASLIFTLLLIVQTSDLLLMFIFILSLIASDCSSFLLVFTEHTVAPRESSDITWKIATVNFQNSGTSLL